MLHFVKGLWDINGCHMSLLSNVSLILCVIKVRTSRGAKCILFTASESISVEFINNLVDRWIKEFAYDTKEANGEYCNEDECTLAFLETGHTGEIFHRPGKHFSSISS